MSVRPEGTEMELALLEEAMRSPDAARRRSALDRAPIHPAAEPLVLAALGDPAGDVRRAAVRALARRGGGAASRAIAAVSREDPSPAVRAEALTALAAILRRRGPRPS